MDERPAAAPDRALLWDEASELTPRFWAGLVALLLLHDFPTETSDRFRVEASENGLLIEDPSLRTKWSASTFVPWSTIADIRLGAPDLHIFVTIVQTDGKRLRLGEGHATPSKRQQRFDDLQRWFERYREPAPA